MASELLIYEDGDEEANETSMTGHKRATPPQPIHVLEKKESTTSAHKPKNDLFTKQTLRDNDTPISNTTPVTPKANIFKTI